MKVHESVRLAAAAALALMFSSSARADILSSKRGYGDTGAAYKSTQSIGAGWYYNYGTAPSNIGNYNATFYPMIAGGGQLTGGSIDYALSQTSTYLLGYNEPERSDQGNLTVAQGISGWDFIYSEKQRLNPSVQLVSPAVSDDSAGVSWLEQFMATEGSKVDAVAFHWYDEYTTNGDQAASDFESKVQWYHTYFNKPVFITEFGDYDFSGNADYNASVAAETEMLKDVVPWLESQSYVSGYSWYNFFNTSALNTGNPLHPAPIGYVYSGSVQAGTTSDLAGINIGEHAAYLSGGTLTMSVNTGTAKYIEALAPSATSLLTSTISGSSDWSLTNSSTGTWVQVDAGATLLKSGTDTINFGSAVITDNGVLQIAQGVLRFAGSSSGSGSILISSTGDATGSTARLELTNNVTVSNFITFAQRSDPGGSDGIRNVSGNNTLSGPIDITVGGSQARVESDAGLLTLSGNISTDATSARNFYLQGAGNGIVSGVISNNVNNSGGTINVTKQGTGAWTLTGSNTFAGATTVQGGRLALTGSGSINNTSGITINGAGAKFVHDSSVTLTPPVTVNLGTFDGTGTTSNSVVVNSGGVVANGDGTAGVLTVSSLTLNSGSAATPRIGGGTITTAFGIAVSNQLGTDLNNANANTINVIAPGGSITANTYDVIHYGSFAGSISDFNLGSVVGASTRQSITLVNDSANSALAISVTGSGGNLFWTGASNGNWSTGSTGNWSNTANSNPADDYFEGDVVTFDDSVGTGPTTISVPASGVSPGSVTFNNSSAETYTLNGGAIGGITTNLTLSGAGKVILNTSNTYGGTTTISGGTLQLGSGGTTGSLAASSSIADNGTLIFNRSNAVTQGTDFSAAAITGTGSIVQNGPGLLLLNTANTYTGGTTVNAGTVQLTTTAGAANTGVFNLGGGTFQVNLGTGTNFSYAPTINLTANSTIGNAAPGSLLTLEGQVNLTGTINGNGKVLNVVNTGVARLYLNGPVHSVSQINVLSGAMGFDLSTTNHGGGAPVVVSSGAALWFANSGNAISNAITFNGGTGINNAGALYYEGPSTAPTAISSAITLASGNTSVGAVSAADTITLSGKIAGAGALTKTTADTYVLSGGSTFSGGTTISSGTLAVALSSTPSTNGAIITSGPVGTGSLILGGGTLTDSGGNQTIANPITVSASGGTITAASGADFTVNGNISGSGPLMLSGILNQSGLPIGGTNSGYTGTVTVTGANTRLYSAAAASAAATWVVNGNLQFNTAGTNTFNLGALSSTVGTGGISGHATNSATAISTLSVGALNTSTAFSGKIGDMPDNSNALGNVDSSSNNVVALTKVGTGTLLLAGLNTFTGNVIVNGGQLSAGTDIGTTYNSSNLGTLTPTAGRIITVNSTATLSLVGGNVLGTGGSTDDLANISINLNGGVLQTGLNGSGTGWWNKIGKVNLSGGTIHVGSGANNSNFQGLALIGTITATGTSASTIDNYSLSNSTTNGVHLGQNGTVGQSITFNVADVTSSSAVDLTVAPRLLDTSSNLVPSGLTKTGAGTLLLSGYSTFNGDVVINGGEIRAGSDIGNTYNNSNLGTLTPTSTRNITINSGALLSLTGGNVFGTGGSTDDLANVVLNINGGTLQTGLNSSGTGWWNKIGKVNLSGGTIHVGSGANNTNFQGLALIGTVNAIGTAASTIDNYAASNSTSDGIHLDQNATAGQSITFNVADVTSSTAVDLTVAPNLLNTSASLVASGLIKTGAGTMLLTGTSSYSGATNVSAGTLTISGSIAGSTNVSTAVNAVLNANGTTNAGLSTTTTLTSNGFATIGASTGTVIRPVRLTSINIGTAGLLTATSPALFTNRTVLVAGALTINGNGTLDLGANDLIVTNAGAAGLSTITSQLTRGYASGNWNGSGIVSTAAAGNSSHLTALGVILNNGLYGSGTGSLGTFDTINPGTNDVLVKYTYYGDTNLDGLVDGSDYSRLDTAYLNNSNTSNTTLSGWGNGDFNYDGVIDGSDYTLIDNAFNSQGARLTAEIASSTALITGEQNSVPEPTSILLYGVAALSLLSRRLRRQNASISAENHK